MNELAAAHTPALSDSLRLSTPLYGELRCKRRERAGVRETAVLFLSAIILFYRESRGKRVRFVYCSRG